MYDVVAVLRALGWVSEQKKLMKTVLWGNPDAVPACCFRAQSGPGREAAASVVRQLVCHGYVIPEMQREYMVVLVLFGLGLVERCRQGGSTVYWLMRSGQNQVTFTV